MDGSIRAERSILVAAVGAVLADARIAYVCGSLLTPGFDARSDNDAEADVGRRLSFDPLDEMRRRCAEATGRDVGVIDFHATDTIIRMQVLRRGEPVIVNDRRALAVFAMRAVSERLDFRIDRRVIEAGMQEPHAAGR